MYLYAIDLPNYVIIDTNSIEQNQHSHTKRHDKLLHNSEKSRIFHKTCLIFGLVQARVKDKHDRMHRILQSELILWNI